MVLEVADMLVDVRLPVDNQRHAVFQIAAHGQDRAIARQPRDRGRRVSSRPAQDRSSEHACAHDGVVEPPRDRPLAHEPRVCDAFEPEVADGVAADR